MAVFLHFWYWFPCVHFFALTLSPSGLIGVNKNLRIPKGFQFKSNAKPSMYDYPAHIKPDDKKKEVKKETVQLSITEKAKARAAKKQAEGGQTEKDLDTTKKDGKMDVEEKKEGVEEEKKKVEEPNFKICNNHSRVLPKQQETISYLEDNRYAPVLKVNFPIAFDISRTVKEASFSCWIRDQEKEKSSLILLVTQVKIDF